MPDGTNAGPGYAKHPGYKVDPVPCPKRVRVEVAGATIADSEAALLVLETAHTPVYYFPEADLRLDLMTANDHDSYCPFKGTAAYWHVEAGGRRVENAVWGYPEPFDEVAGLVGYRAFYWDRMDHWLEEDEEVFVHPRDPHVRIDILASKRRVVVEAGGRAVAESTEALFLFETGLPVRYYLPRKDVARDRLTATDLVTACPYKGEAGHWRLTDDGGAGGAGSPGGGPEIAWHYPAPLAEVGRIKDHICFYNERVDRITVDGRAVDRPHNKWSAD